MAQEAGKTGLEPEIPAEGLVWLARSPLSSFLHVRTKPTDSLGSQPRPWLALTLLTSTRPCKGFAPLKWGR